MGGVSQVASRSRGREAPAHRVPPAGRRRGAHRARRRRDHRGSRRALAHSAVDLNPHQIEAAAFALASLPTGGAVLADEVGLGKTIEAGIVLAQLAAEGKGRALILVPASLRAQWRDELRDEVRARGRGRRRRLACARTSGRGSGRTRSTPAGSSSASHPFAALQRVATSSGCPGTWRSSTRRTGCGTPTASDHQTGQALRKALRKCPKLLLTATPLQNDLMELLGLAAFIDDALLGNEEAFRAAVRRRASSTEDRAADLKARLAPVFIRTLRRQVQEYVKYTARRSHRGGLRARPRRSRSSTTASPSTCAATTPTPSRRRGARCSSSSTARSSPPRPSRSRATLDRLADTLDEKLAGRRVLRPGRTCVLEMDGFAEEAEELFDDGRERAAAHGQAALRRMQRRAVRAPRTAPGSPASIKVNAKGEALVRGLDRCFTVAKACGWPEKAVVFTEFRRTQDYLTRLLEAKGYSRHLPLRRRRAAPTSGRRSSRSSATARRSCS